MERQIQHRLFLVLYLFVSVYTVILSLGNLGVFMVNLSIAVLGAIVLAVLNKFDSDEQYYLPLNLAGVSLILVAVLSMVMVAVAFGHFAYADALSLFTVKNSIFPLSHFSNSFNLPAYSAFPALADVQTPTSVVTSLINDLLVTVFMVAGFEEGLKLVGFGELRSLLKRPLSTARKEGKLLVAILIAGVFVVLPVGFWALTHGLEAFSNPWLIISAFVNGLILLVVLWKMGFLAAVLAHGSYNAFTIILSYLQGNHGLGFNLPLFALQNWADGLALLLFCLALGLLVVPIGLQKMRL